MMDRVKLIVGMISNDAKLFDAIQDILTSRFGAVDFASPALNFDRTSYYNDEMGEGLKRKFLSFRNLKKLNGIEKAKLLTNDIEKRFSTSGRRKINIDPGYLEPSKLVLLTTKNYSHRIYVGRGIYAEVTLCFRGSSFRAWEWTYPDYKSGAYINIFNEIRRLYSNQLKGRTERVQKCP